MSVPFWICWLMLAAAARPDVGERLTLAVSPAQSFAPTTLTVRVHVRRDSENRALEVVAASGDYYRSSHIQLDGDQALQTIVVELRSLPAGNYEVSGALIDTSGRACAVARRQAIVLGSADSRH
jgi:hypothetical protein